MKRIILGTIAAFALTACASTMDDPNQKAAVEPEAVMVCAVKNPDGTCACKKVDDNGDCIEGGGPGVIVQGGDNR